MAASISNSASYQITRLLVIAITIIKLVLFSSSTSKLIYERKPHVNELNLASLHVGLHEAKKVLPARYLSEQSVGHFSYIRTPDVTRADDLAYQQSCCTSSLIVSRWVTGWSIHQRHKPTQSNRSS